MFVKLQSWFQGRKEQIFLAILLFMIISVSFGLGYLIRGEASKAPIVIEKCSELKPWQFSSFII